MKKKLLAGLLVAMSIITFAPTSVFATDEKQSSGNTALDEFLKKHKTEESDFKLDFSGSDTSNFKADTQAQPVQVKLYEGWNVEGDNPDKICKVINGEKVKGWYNGAVNWYYFNDNGYMVRSSWVNTGANWYYVGADGTMLRDICIAGRYVNLDGVADASKNDFSLGQEVMSSKTKVVVPTVAVYNSSTGKSSLTNEEEAKSLHAQGKLGVRVERGSTQWTDNANDLKWFTK